jgi:epoxyqueuosine reductase
MIPPAEALRAVGRAAGLDVVEVASAEPFVDVRTSLEERKAAGLHGGMAFTYRQPARSTDPGAALPDAAALVVGARSYLVDDAVAGDRPDAAGRVARYAWEDHYAHLKAGLRAMAVVLKAEGWRFVFTPSCERVDVRPATRSRSQPRG